MTYSGSKAQSGRGSTLSIGGTPVEIGEVSDFPFTRPEWDFVDVTNFDSGADQEMIPTIRKAQTITFKGNRVSSDTGQLAVETAYAGPTVAVFTLVLPKTAAQTTSGDKYVFSAWVKNVNFDISPTKQIEFNVTLQTTSSVVFTAGS